MKVSRNNVLKSIAVVLLVAAGSSIFYFSSVRATLESFNRWAGSQGTAGLMIFALIYAVATVLFVPGSPMTLAGGFMFGLWHGFLAVWLGATLGAGAAFLTGRYLGRGPIEARARSSVRFRRLDEALAREGWKVIFLLRLSPLIPFNLVNYLFALTGIRFWPYLWASAVGMAPGTLLYVYLGVASRSGARMALGEAGSADRYKSVLLALGLVATLVATVLLSRLAQKALQKSSLEWNDVSD